MAEKDTINLTKEKMYISINDTLYTVLPYIEGERLEKGVAYIYKDKVYIYDGKMNKHKYIEAGHAYKDDDGKVHFVKPESVEHDVDNVVMVNKQAMNEMDDADLKTFDPRLAELNESNIFAPTINPEDDILKRAIKTVLGEMKIDLRLYKDRFRNEYDITNMKSAINKPSNMTIKYLVKWCEILNLDLSVNVKFKDANGEDAEISVNLK